MKNIAKVMFIIGLISVIYGICSLLFLDNTNTSTNIEFTGKYTSTSGNIYIYEDSDNKIYFTINNEIYGKADFDKNKIIGIVNEVSYEFTLNGNTLDVKTSNLTVNGQYKKEKTLTLEEFYSLNYGDMELLNVSINGKYISDKMEIIIYQAKKDEILGYIKDKGKTLILKFTVDSSGQLNSSNSNDSYIMSVRENKLLYTFEGDLDFVQEELMFDGRVTYKDVLELYINT